MKLSSNSIDRLAEEIAPKVYRLMGGDIRYAEGLQNSIVSATSEVMGDADPRIVGSVANRIIDMIGVIGSDSASADIWKSRYETLYRYVKTNYAESYVDGAEYGIMGCDYGVE